jgi:8-oxo-dGTP diphosphatase
MKRYPTVGVGVAVFNRMSVLIGKRGPACKIGAGCWAFPGGHIDSDESMLQTVTREVQEETSLRINVLGQHYTEGMLTSSPFAVTDHYSLLNHITLWFAATVQDENCLPLVVEPDKCTEWRWVDFAELLTIPGCRDPYKEQYQWLPYDVFQTSLYPIWNSYVIGRFPGHSR